VRRFIVRVTAAALLTAALTAQSPPNAFVIRNVRVFDGESVAAQQTVVISLGKIAGVGINIAVPAGAQEISGEGRTLLPGLIDAHVHLPAFGSADALQQMLAFGVTTGVVMGVHPLAVSRLKDIKASDAPDVAALLSAGLVATAPGGHPLQMDGGGPGGAYPTLTTAGEADGWVAARLTEGSDFIKIIYDDTSDAYARTLPTLDEPTVAALVTAAHARGKLAVAHIGNERYARGAIAAGVDGLAHLFVGPTVSADFGRFAASHGVFVIPTLSVLYSACGKSDGPEFLKDASIMSRVKPQFRPLLEMPLASSAVSCEAAPQAIRQLVAAKVPMLAGTDAPAPGLTYGASVHKELEHLVAAGLTPTAALAGATSAIARAFRISDRGRIAPGLRADLLLVNGDPTKDIRATRNVVRIWKKGVAFQ
jgi:imidazolonepropionase-like amidohydrolase